MLASGSGMESRPSYAAGDIVWVKLSKCWWPGEVKNQADLPADLVADFKKPPLVIVKFFDEDSYEYVKNWSGIYPYNSDRKTDFIKRGMVGYRSKFSHMAKFPKDIGTAEERTGGNPNILSEPEFLPPKKINLNEIFGTPSPKKAKNASTVKKPSANDPLITHRRFLGNDDYKATIWIQYPCKDRKSDSEDEDIKEMNKDSRPDLTCDICDFHTKNAKALVWHCSSHFNGVTGSTPKRKPKKPKDTDSNDTSERKTKPKQPKKKKLTVNKPADGFEDLLQDWEESEEEEEASSSKKETESSAVARENGDASKSPSTKTTHQDDIKNCFDFDEEEEEENLYKQPMGNRKIPRVIPEKPRESITEMLERDIGNSAENLDSISTTAKPPENVEKTTSMDNGNPSQMDDSLNETFKELMQETEVPRLDETSHNLKSEQNFHDARTVKFPDKGGTTPTSGESPSKTVGTSKKRFITSFEDFEAGFKKISDDQESQQKRAKEYLLKSYKIPRKSGSISPEKKPPPPAPAQPPLHPHQQQQDKRKSKRFQPPEEPKTADLDAEIEEIKKSLESAPKIPEIKPKPSEMSLEQLTRELEGGADSPISQKMIGESAGKSTKNLKEEEEEIVSRRTRSARKGLVDVQNEPNKSKVAEETKESKEPETVEELSKEIKESGTSTTTRASRDPRRSKDAKESKVIQDSKDAEIANVPKDSDSDNTRLATTSRDPRKSKDSNAAKESKNEDLNESKDADASNDTKLPENTTELTDSKVINEESKDLNASKDSNESKAAEDSDKSKPVEEPTDLIGTRVTRRSRRSEAPKESKVAEEREELSKEAEKSKLAEESSKSEDFKVSRVTRSSKDAKKSCEVNESDGSKVAEDSEESKQTKDLVDVKIVEEVKESKVTRASKRSEDAKKSKGIEESKDSTKSKVAEDSEESKDAVSAKIAEDARQSKVRRSSKVAEEPKKSEDIKESKEARKSEVAEHSEQSKQTEDLVDVKIVQEVKESKVTRSSKKSADAKKSEVIEDPEGSKDAVKMAEDARKSKIRRSSKFAEEPKKCEDIKESKEFEKSEVAQDSEESKQIKDLVDAKIVQEMKESKVTRGSKRSEDAKKSKVIEDPEGSKDAVSAKIAEDARQSKVRRSSKVAEEPKKSEDIKESKESKESDVAEYSEGSKQTKDLVDVKIVEEVKESKVTKGSKTYEDAKKSEVIEDPEEFKDAVGVKMTEDAKKSKNRRSSKVAEDPKKPEDIKESKESKESEVAEDSEESKQTKDLVDVKIVQEMKESKVTRGSKRSEDAKKSKVIEDPEGSKDAVGIKMAEDARKSKDRRSSRVAEESKKAKDIKDSKESKKSEVAEDSEESKQTKDLVDVKESKVTRGSKKSEDAKKSKVTEDPEESKVAVGVKMAEIPIKSKVRRSSRVAEDPKKPEDNIKESKESEVAKDSKKSTQVQELIEVKKSEENRITRGSKQTKDSDVVESKDVKDSDDAVKIKDPEEPKEVTKDPYEITLTESKPIKASEDCRDFDTKDSTKSKHSKDIKESSSKESKLKEDSEIKDSNYVKESQDSKESNCRESKRRKSSRSEEIEDSRSRKNSSKEKELPEVDSIVQDLLIEESISTRLRRRSDKPHEEAPLEVAQKKSRISKKVVPERSFNEVEPVPSNDARKVDADVFPKLRKSSRKSIEIKLHSAPIEVAATTSQEAISFEVMMEKVEDIPLPPEPETKKRVGGPDFSKFEKFSASTLPGVQREFKDSRRVKVEQRKGVQTPSNIPPVKQPEAPITVWQIPPLDEIPLPEEPREPKPRRSKRHLMATEEPTRNDNEELDGVSLAERLKRDEAPSGGKKRKSRWEEVRSSETIEAEDEVAGKSSEAPPEAPPIGLSEQQSEVFVVETSDAPSIGQQSELPLEKISEVEKQTEVFVDKISDAPSTGQQSEVSLEKTSEVEKQSEIFSVKTSEAPPVEEKSEAEKLITGVISEKVYAGLGPIKVRKPRSRWDQIEKKLDNEPPLELSPIKPTPNLEELKKLSPSSPVSKSWSSDLALDFVPKLKTSRDIILEDWASETTDESFELRGSTKAFDMEELQDSENLLGNISVSEIPLPEECQQPARPEDFQKEISIVETSVLDEVSMKFQGGEAQNCIEDYLTEVSEPKSDVQDSEVVLGSAGICDNEVGASKSDYINSESLTGVSQSDVEATKSDKSIEVLTGFNENEVGVEPKVALPQEAVLTSDASIAINQTEVQVASKEALKNNEVQEAESEVLATIKASLLINESEVEAQVAEDSSETRESSLSLTVDESNRKEVPDDSNKCEVDPINEVEVEQQVPQSEEQNKGVSEEDLLKNEVSELDGQKSEPLANTFPGTSPPEELVVLEPSEVEITGEVLHSSEVSVQNIASSEREVVSVVPETTAKEETEVPSIKPEVDAPKVDQKSDEVVVKSSDSLKLSESEAAKVKESEVVDQIKSDAALVNDSSKNLAEPEKVPDPVCPKKGRGRPRKTSINPPEASGQEDKGPKQLKEEEPEAPSTGLPPKKNKLAWEDPAKAPKSEVGELILPPKKSKRVSESISTLSDSFSTADDSFLSSSLRDNIEGIVKELDASTSEAATCVPPKKKRLLLEEVMAEASSQQPQVPKKKFVQDMMSPLAKKKTFLFQEKKSESTEPKSDDLMRNTQKFKEQEPSYPQPTPPESAELVSITVPPTVMSEQDLADAQVEISSDKKQQITKSETKGTEFTSKAMLKEFDARGQGFRAQPSAYFFKSELLDILEGNSNSSTNSSGSEQKFKTSFDNYDKNKGIVQGIIDFEEEIPSQIVVSSKAAAGSVLMDSPKLLERLSMPNDQTKVTTVNVQPPKDSPKPLEDAAKRGLKMPKPGQKILIKKPRSTKTGPNKPIILAEQIIRPANAQENALKRPYEDIEDVGKAFVISKVAKTEPAEEIIAPAPALNKNKKNSGKAMILQQTIITPKGEIIPQPPAAVPPAATSTAIPEKPNQQSQDVFDINAMPIVLSDDLLTPESIQNMPVVLSEDAVVTQNVAPPSVKDKMQAQVVQKKAVMAAVSGKQHVPMKPAPQLPKTRLLHQNTVAQSQVKVTKPVVTPALLATGTTPDGKTAKYVLVPPKGTPMPEVKSLKSAIFKKALTQQPATGVPVEPSNVPPTTGNKIMIVTNAQGQQTRLVLTPQQQKAFMGQGGSKTKTVIKGTFPKALLETAITSSGATLPIAGHTSGLLMPVNKPPVAPPAAKKAPQRAKAQKTILIKNQLGQTVRKIQGTDDADLDRQVAEQLEAIKASARLQQIVKPPPEVANVPSRPTPTTINTAKQIHVRRPPPKKIETTRAKLTVPMPTPLPVVHREPEKLQETKVPALTPISAVQERVPQLPQTTAPSTTAPVTRKPVSSISKPPEAPQTEVKPETKRPESPVRQVVIQDGLGNLTTVTVGQILAIPSETVDGQPQSYMLVTVDESGNLTALNNDALASLDPSLGLSGGDLNNQLVLQMDQGQQQGTVAAIGKPPVEDVKKTEERLRAEVPLKAEPLKVPEKLPFVEQQVVIGEGILPGDSGGQQLLLSGDPIATQKFLESLSDGTTDLANILANAEGGSVMIQADGQNILIRTTPAAPLPGVAVPENTEGAGNPIFATHKPNQDILAAALANTDVFPPSDSPLALTQGKVTSQLSPGGGALYPMHVGNVLETSLTLSSPIMTPLEVPSTNRSKKIDDEADILNQIPKNVDLPITITDPNISQTVAHQSAASLMELNLPISETGPTTMVEMNSPSYSSYSLSNLDDSVGISQKHFGSSMPLLTEDLEDPKDKTCTVKQPVSLSSFDDLASTREEIVKTSSVFDIESMPILTTDDVIEDSGSSMGSTKPQRSSPKIIERSEEDDDEEEEEEGGLSTLGGEMCSSLSEPPPDMFDLSSFMSNRRKPPEEEEEELSSDFSSLPMASSEENSGEIPLQPPIVANLRDLKRTSDSDSSSADDKRARVE